ncbi:ribokinase [Cytobacillus depressus]|uniref:Ribokinase n=1 Tax=Cytobacillus depressus TaxID=1602942 RepID=A0A6L3V288_9BACI|nr:ribokinase [Cytobacillus depressus]KAB2333100.1 ribokinase [Cytobacillus depressus]
MNQTIVVVGSLNMDMVISAKRMPKLGETILGESIYYLPGGKGANQAVGIAKLGGDVKMVGAVGEDSFSDAILDQLHHYKVDTEHIERIPNAATGVASIFHTESDNCITVIPGANYSFTSNRITKRIEQIIAQAKVLLVQLEIPLETVQYVLSIAKQHGVKTILNPAPAQHLTPQLLALADYITPNETELEVLLGFQIASEQELEKAMKDWQEKYNNTLIVTLGEKGSAYLDNKSIKIIPSEKVKVVDTTGAGDSFNAALAFGIASDWPLDQAVSFAVKASGQSVTKFGAQEGMPYYEEVSAD